MNGYTTYAVWTYDTVRAQIVEAADTLMMNPAALGPRLAGLSQEVVHQAEESYGYSASAYKRIPTPGALARMEETWTWINTWLKEDDRKLVYEYGFIMTRKGLNIAGWCERNGWVKRTFERAVNRCCQRIANELNRKHEVRLTMAFDGVSQIEAKHASFEVASDSRAPVRHKAYHRADDAIPSHIEGSEAEVAHHIEAVNKDRRQDAERQRKAAQKKREDAERLVSQIAARQAKRKQARAA